MAYRFDALSLCIKTPQISVFPPNWGPETYLSRGNSDTLQVRTTEKPKITVTDADFDKPLPVQSSIFNLEKMDDILGENSSSMSDRVDADASINMDDQVNVKPEVGMKFDTLGDAWELWEKYGWWMGFGVRKNYNNKRRKDGVISNAVYVCNKEGRRAEDKRVVGIVRRRWEIRTNCKVMVNIALERDTGKYKVKEFVEEHNHALEPTETRKWLLETRKYKVNKFVEEHNHALEPPETRKWLIHGTMTRPQDSAFDLSCSSGITFDAAHELRSRKVAERANIGNQQCHKSTIHTTKSNIGVSKRSLRLPVSAISQNSTTAESKDALKRALAKRAVGLVKSGMVIGLGTGSTASVVVEELGKLIRQGQLKDIFAVAANYQSRILAKQFGVKTVDLNDVNAIDIAFDGADEVDFNKNLLKGGGAAHTMQKVIDSVAKECVILVDHAKVVRQLGSTSPVPVEVLPPAISPVLRQLATLGGVPEVRLALRKDGPVVTDLGNMMVDVRFSNGIQNAAELERRINMIPGVVENGKRIFCSSHATFLHIHCVVGILSGSRTSVSVLVGSEDAGNITVKTLEEIWNSVIIAHRDGSNGESRHQIPQ
ncbi:ribose-5-phosphate isomerase 3 chloroplastic [Tripterygium wilfordii]|uniref:ribose-5-phosphate isomerase n=1 Tax=Tripterygium wilfordii TaxID=458696 RepID=A0A7J7DVG6_TRIWF|nr:ribose-5-phosphate isomerase 3 chloroplastic [Tripterygium wilfordii]